jgi:hypothetical protein
VEFENGMVEAQNIFRSWRDKVYVIWKMVKEIKIRLG